MNQTICEAIRNKRLLEFTYDGYARTVEPHTHGRDTKGHDGLRAFQVSGGSESGRYRGWKLFHTSEMCGLIMLSESFDSARGGYRQGDPAFIRIYCQI